MTTFIKFVKKSLPVDKFFFHRSYSQEGEDMIYRSFFEGRKNYKGFYVDVGALHPYRYSNTLHFYKNGWRGINIEPTPGANKLFNIFRKKDININAGISANEGMLPFYCFSEPAVNSFSKNDADRLSATTDYKLSQVINVPTMPLAAVLDKYLPEGTVIDFLNIDAEGLDLEVLASNNWDRYRPLFIIIEVKIDFKDIKGSEIYNYLINKNYELVAKTMRTSFFRHKE